MTFVAVTDLQLIIQYVSPAKVIMLATEEE